MFYKKTKIKKYFQIHFFLWEKIFLQLKKKMYMIFLLCAKISNVKKELNKCQRKFFRWTLKEKN